MLEMLERPSQDSGSPEKRYYARKQPRTKDAIDSATIRKFSFAGSMKKAAALIAVGAGAVGFSRLPSGAIPSRNRGYGCRYCHSNVTADRNCVPLWTERARAELLLRFGWDQKLLEPFGDSMNSLAHSLEHIPLPRIIKEPPPLLLLLGSCATLAFAITYLRHTNRTDQYQDKIMAGSLVAATLVGFMSDDFPIQVMMLLPWAVMLGLVLSALLHRCLGLKAEEGNRTDSRWPYRRKEQSAWLEDKEQTDTVKHIL